MGSGGPRHRPSGKVEISAGKQASSCLAGWGEEGGRRGRMENVTKLQSWGDGRRRLLVVVIVMPISSLQCLAPAGHRAGRLLSAH